MNATHVLIDVAGVISLVVLAGASLYYFVAWVWDHRSRRKSYKRGGWSVGARIWPPAFWWATRKALWQWGFGHEGWGERTYFSPKMKAACNRREGDDPPRT